MKFVTFNIQYGIGADGKYDLSRIAPAVASADVIALQEVERHWKRTEMADQPAQIAAALPDYWALRFARDATCVALINSVQDCLLLRVQPC